uniref:Uncharacterized protein n=1 Tax=Branchiostoma floridae TaxID=7739 RepID=C3ZL99_BRAFL|eukprot:XP_002590770.1 hypothetical protein BRAFLDRAFT_78184 [Branchiostoma floridae]
MASLQKVRCSETFLKGGNPTMSLAGLDDFLPVQRSAYETKSTSVFDPDTGEAVADPVKFLLDNGAQFSVYSFDLDRRVLGLVKVMEGVDIRKKPFLYQAQRESAEELLLLPFDVLPAVADALSESLSGVKNIFLHSTGRCGSTLMCKGLDVMRQIQAVSEPDIFTLIFEGAPKMFQYILEHPRMATCPVRHGAPFMFVIFWILHMQKAFDLIQDDSANFFHACLSYDQLLEHKERCILKVLEKLDVDVPNDTDVSDIRAVFGVDSQEGSPMQSGRKKGDEVSSSWVGTWERNFFSTVLAHFDGDVNDPDFVLPNSMVIN